MNLKFLLASVFALTTVVIASEHKDTAAPAVHDAAVPAAHDAKAEHKDHGHKKAHKGHKGKKHDHHEHAKKDEGKHEEKKPETTVAE